MKPNGISFDDIISERDIENGNLILLAGRPAVGKTKTCCEILKKYEEKHKSLYFDLSGHDTKFWIGENEGVILKYHSSVDIIKEIQSAIEKRDIKFVFIDFWQVVGCKEEWFIRMLIELVYLKKLVIIVTTYLDMKVEKRKNHIPLLSDIYRVCSLSQRAKKIIAISYEYFPNKDSKYKYYLYRG